MTIRCSRRLVAARTLRCAAFLALAFLALLVPARAALADDSSGPELVAFSMAPKHVNTESEDQVVTVTLTARDTQTGVGQVNWGLYLPGSAQPGRTVTLVRTSGDLFTGTYTGQIVLPRGSQGGVWLGNLGLSDGVGNASFFRPDDIAALFGSGSQSITNDATDYDSGPPKVAAFSIAPEHVDTVTADQTITVTATLTDDMSGIDHALVELESLTCHGQVLRFDLQRVSGDELRGVYTATATMPKGSAAGKWGAAAYVTDHATNTAVLGHADMRDLFGTSAVEITNDAATWDGSPPAIVAYKVTPTQIDASEGARTLDVSYTVADDGSGIDSVSGYLQPLVGFQVAYFSVTRVSGDDAQADYAGTVTIPQYAKAGIWLPTFFLQDKLGNSGYVRPEDLSQALPDAEGLYVINTAVADEVDIDRGWTLRSGGNSVTFFPGTVVTRRDGGSFAFYQMVASPFTIDETVPTTDLDGKPVATLRFGIPGLNLSFSKEVLVQLAVGSGYDGYRMRVQSLTEDGDAWDDETSADVVAGHLDFTVTHATRFAACLGKPRLSRLQPARLARGATLTLRGWGFGKRRGSVKVGGRTCRTLLSWGAGKVVCKVPAAVRPGRYRVRIVTRRAGASNTRILRLTR